MHASISLVKSPQAKHHTHFKPVEFSTLKDLAEASLVDCWSPCLWIAGQRRRSLFESCQLIVLDFDSGEITLEDCLFRMRKSGLAYAVTTTKSHQIWKVKPSGKMDHPVDRFRLIMPMLNTVEGVENYYRAMRRVFSTVRGCDKACIDPARFYFPGTKLIEVNESPNLWRLVWLEPSEDELAREAEVKAARRQAIWRQRELGTFPPWIRNALTHGAEVGERNKRVFSVSLFLGEAGFSYQQVEDRIMGSRLGCATPEETRRAIAQGHAYGIRRLGDDD